MKKASIILIAVVLLVVNAVLFVEYPENDTPAVSDTDTNVVMPALPSASDTSETDIEPLPVLSQSDAVTDVVTVSDAVEEPPVSQPEAIPADAYEGLTTGDEGYEVSRLQNRLNELGYLTGSLDGQFGRNTEKAISIFQRDAGLHVTGVANHYTTELLYSDNAPPAPESKDHEDVAAPNHNRSYYIIVYRRGCTVLVLGKDDYGHFNQVLKTFICSPGIEDGSATPAKLYETSKYYDWREMVGGTYAQYAIRLEGPIMLHSVTYKKPSPDTLYMDEYEKLGQPASHGCVRMAAGDIKWIYDNIPAGTQVLVTLDEECPAQPAAVPLNYDEAYKGWDPTDPRPENPYNN